MFHCVQQTEGDGGANLWVDGFHAANLLHEENPEAFQILATTPVAFRNYKSIFGLVYHQSHHTVIRLVYNYRYNFSFYFFISLKPLTN